LERQGGTQAAKPLPTIKLGPQSGKHGKWLSRAKGIAGECTLGGSTPERIPIERKGPRLERARGWDEESVQLQARARELISMAANGATVFRRDHRRRPPAGICGHRTLGACHSCRRRLAGVHSSRSELRCGGGGVFPGGTRPVVPPIHLNLNIDGRALAAAVSEGQAQISTYQTDSAAPNGAALYAP
jgi:hypothetical protein